MIKSKLQTIALVLLAAVAFSAPVTMKAQDATPAATATPKAAKAKKEKSLPFKGEVKSVDKTAKTFTIGTTTYTVSDSTKWTGVTLDTLATGAKVTGAYTKDGDTNNATSVKAAKAK